MSLITSFAQCFEWNKLQITDSVFTNPAFGNATTSEIDKLDRPYVYLAMVSGGVKIFDSHFIGKPTLIATVPKSNLGNLDAINLFQDSIWLYVSLGNIWSTNEMSGLAIIDVRNPIIPVVLDVFIYQGQAGGAGAVETRGKYAYLAANQNGLIILDVSNKSKIQFTSSLPLSNNFPHTNIGSNSQYNARGIGLKDNYAYICYDRGGLRIVDISDVHKPVQVNQYCFSALINKATAYNNIAIDDNIAYVAIDYYGMEVLDISDPFKIIQLAWWHPDNWADTTNNYNTWANSEGHANEIVCDVECNKVYVAAGKSDVVVLDVSNPHLPVTCETYGSTTDDYGTWGIDYYNHKISVAYIWSPAFPPYSNYTGFKILQLSCKPNGWTEKESISDQCILFLDPLTDLLHLELQNQKIEKIKIYNLTGELIQELVAEDLNLQNLPCGIYILQVQTNVTTFIRKFLKK